MSNCTTIVIGWWPMFGGIAMFFLGVAGVAWITERVLERFKK